MSARVAKTSTSTKGWLTLIEDSRGLCRPSRPSLVTLVPAQSKSISYLMCCSRVISSGSVADSGEVRMTLKPQCHGDIEVEQQEDDTIESGHDVFECR